MIRVLLHFTPIGCPPQELGTFDVHDLEAARALARSTWPLLPDPMVTITQVSRGRGFQDPETRAKALETLRSTEVQRRKVAARLATEAIRRAKEAEMPPIERERLRRRRAKAHAERWRQHYLAKARRSDAE